MSTLKPKTGNSAKRAESAKVQEGQEQSAVSAPKTILPGPPYFTRKKTKEGGD